MTWIAISNDWDRSVDVYAASVWQPGTMIGTVAAGTRGEFPLSDGASYSLRVSGGDSAVPVAARQRIRTQYLCR
jgi:hypothetical protein